MHTLHLVSSYLMWEGQVFHHHKRLDPIISLHPLVA